jgi:hypothetical protein
MARPKKLAEEPKEIKEVKESPVKKSTLTEFIYETNGIKYKKIFKDGVIVERVRI